MKNRTLPGKYLVTIVAFCKFLKKQLLPVIYVMLLLFGNQVLPVQSSQGSDLGRLVLPTETTIPKEVCLMSSSTTVIYVLKWFIINENIPAVHGEIYIFNQSRFPAADYANKCGAKNWGTDPLTMRRCSKAFSWWPCIIRCAESVVHGSPNTNRPR